MNKNCKVSLTHRLFSVSNCFTDCFHKKIVDTAFHNAEVINIVDAFREVIWVDFM